MTGSEPFPLLNTSADQLHQANGHASSARRRRKSSALGSDLYAGDTGAPGLATSIAHHNQAHPSHHRSHQTDKDDSRMSSSDTAAAPSKRFSKRRKARSLLRRFKHYAIKHTWVLPLALLSLFLTGYAVNPTEANPIHKFIFLSYRLPPSPDSPPDAHTQYGKGPWDFALVFFYTIVLSFTREFIMLEMLRPVAHRLNLKSRGKIARFMEQTYTSIYFGILGPSGLYVMSRTPIWYFSIQGMYEGFPHKTHDALFKFYYLFQAAYWAQQAIVLVLGMEKPRKDFRELVGHHIVSLSLIGLSYRFHFTYIGLAVYITHDISDFFLATSKTLNYLDHVLVGPYFFLFMCVWIYTRHFLNIRILKSVFFEFQTIGPYGMDWENEQYKGDVSFWFAVCLLGSLQGLNLFWLFYIVRIAYRFLVRGTATDDRSEAESGEEDEVEELPEKKRLAGKGNGTVVNGAVNGVGGKEVLRN